MSDTTNDMPTWIDQQQLAQEPVEAARADGVKLVGPGQLIDIVARIDLAAGPQPRGA